MRIIPSHVRNDVLIIIAAATLHSGLMRNPAIFMALLLAGQQMNVVQSLGPRNVKNVSSNVAHYFDIFKSSAKNMIQVGNRLNILYNIIIMKANTSTTTPATTTSHAMTTIRSTTTTAASNTTTRPSTSTGHKNVETSTTHIRKGSYVPFLLPSRKKRVIRYAFT